jgi:D-alanine--poly(phosphoribitol) ligase subunit 1
MNHNATAPFDVLDAFWTQAKLRPDVTAVEHNGLSTSYGELKNLAGRIASAIQEFTSTPSPRVLLALPASAEAYAAMIGTLAAGGTFCPVNILGPDSRNATITNLFSPHIILFQGNAPALLDQSPATTPRIDVTRLGNNSVHCPANEYSEVSYVVFTSGSTGEPKGVKIGRTGFSHFLVTARPYFDLLPAERWGQFSNLGYDLAVMDAFLALTSGGTLVPLATKKDQFFPATAIKDKNISIWQSVPSVIDLMVRAGQVTASYLSSLRIMSFCGEPLLPHHLDALFAARPDLQVFNTYGATETVGFNTINRLSSNNYRESCEYRTVSLGEDVPGWKLSLRGGDSNDEGEIVVSSDFLSLGYFGDEDRTRNAFRQMRTAEAEERRTYFTGDWGIRKNSRLYFSGRRDRQVKIRGERIELGEVDYILREAGFPSAHTIYLNDELYSFVESNDPIDENLVRNYLVRRLPFHSVPKSIRAISGLPKNSNGKVDRAALEKLVE